MFAFDSTPGLATSYADARKLYAAARGHLESRLDRMGLMLLYSVAWPPQAIYTKKPIERLADLRGAKFRSFNPSTARFADLIGASAVTIQVPEIAQAFRTGVLDAMITSGATGVDSQAWDYLTHYYDVNAFLPQNVVIVNKAAFHGLPADVRTAITDAAKRAEERGWRMSEELNEGYKKTLAEKGIKGAPRDRRHEGRTQADRRDDGGRVGEARRRRRRGRAEGVSVISSFSRPTRARPCWARI
jgi:TRAP-type transport system periplasmic protein